MNQAPEVAASPSCFPARTMQTPSADGLGWDLDRVVACHMCVQCSMPIAKAKRCKNCGLARYCSRECQLAHWAGLAHVHPAAIVAVAHLDDHGPPAAVRQERVCPAPPRRPAIAHQAPPGATPHRRTAVRSAHVREHQSMGWDRLEYGKLTGQCSEPVWPPRVDAFSRELLLKLLLF